MVTSKQAKMSAQCSPGYIHTPTALCTSATPTLTLTFDLTS